MPKYTFAWLSGSAVILQSLLPLIAPAEQGTWLRWRIGGLTFGALALIGLTLQLCLQNREEKKLKLEQEERRLIQERREQGRDKLMQELLDRIPKRQMTHDSATAPPPKPSLSARMKQTARQLFDFLDERGIRPSVAEFADKSLSLEERLGHVVRVVGPWVEAVAFGYEHRFKADLQSMLAEMRERGINSGITDADLEPPHGQDADGIRDIADRLLMTAVRLDTVRIETIDSN